MDIVYELASEAAGDLGIGVAIWLLALWLPFRAVTGKAEIGWDVVGLIASTGFGLLIVVGLEEPFIEWADARAGGWHALLQPVPWWGALAIYVVASDFGAYWAHRLLHTRYLWDAHAWHHSPRYLYFLSGMRAAPLHMLVLIAPYTVAYVLFPYPSAVYVVAAHAAFQLANQHYLHSNVRVPWPHYLEYVLVTPRFHFVHHSAARAFCDSNYGFIFSVWDRWFGTYTDPATVPSDQPLGLNYQIGHVRALLGLPKRRASSRPPPLAQTESAG